uniref:Uncharacterized protein n=1 Tax=Siphoviridae sp. ctBLh2 TaxID=2827803 RepID=A0A8S5S3V7_9CAUD|nr:MAG TPA: hypothetical protein [Siphoviridae sp. ctBLh2]
MHYTHITETTPNIGVVFLLQTETLWARKFGE